ncbi:MAG: beta-galactosidase [Thermoguttaceae bacterium]
MKACCSRLRWLAVAPLVMLLAGLAGPAGVRADESGELLKNPGFDEPLEGKEQPRDWGTSPDRVLWREIVYLGKNYSIASRGDAYVLATQDIRLEPDRRYTIRLRLKGDGGALGGALILHGEDKPTREMPILWNVQPSAEFENYVGTFVAPDPVARLLIYNVARTGTIEYDSVSLREGEPDEPIIGQLSLRPIDRPLGEVPETRHIDWASPLPGGPVKTCFTLRTFLLLRDAIELAQRVDLDYDVIHTGYEGDECISDTARRATRRLGDGSYEVYVVASRLSGVLVKTIRQRVEAGAGLVVLEGFGQGTKFLPADQWKAVDDSHYLRTAVPWDLVPEKILSSVQMAQIGKGRAVRLVFPLDTARVWGLLPSENSMEAYKSRRLEYWEWWQSLLARAIVWGARREGTAALVVTGEGERLAAGAHDAPQGSRLRVTWRSGREIRFDGPLVRLTPREIPLLGAGPVELAVPPELPAGSAIADLALLDAQGNVLDWRSCGLSTPQRCRVAELKTDRPSYPAGAEVKLSARLAAPAAVEATLEARLIDAFGRVVAAGSRPCRLAAGETDEQLVLPVRSPLCVHHRAVVRLVCRQREEDSRWVDVLVPEVGPRRAGADFLATTWAPGMTHPVLLSEFSARTRQLGLNSEFGSNLYAMSEHGLPCAGYIGDSTGAFRCDKYTGNGIRPSCLSDPAVVDRFTAQARETAAQQQPYGMFAVGITDEAFLTSRHRRDEVCFCPYCRKRFQAWLESRYPSLDALNAQWGTAFNAWEEVRGATTDQVRGKANYAPFVDFRTFMTDVWVEGCRTITQAYHEVSPRMPVGHTNTFGADPFNGNDYWKLCTQVGFGWGQEYSEAIKSQGQKAIFDLWRSFVETPQSRAARGAAPATGSDGVFFNYGWVGYDHRAAAAHYEPWWLALHGSRGVSYYATNSMDVSRGTSWSLVYPSLQPTAYSEAVAEGVRDLRAGCGKVFMEYRREEPRIAVLWSYPSMLVSWCESSGDEPEPSEQPGSDSFATHYLSALHFRQHLNEQQLDYIYRAQEQVLGSDVLNNYGVLFLPFTVAMSRPLVEKLQAYVEQGGILVGDLRCLRTDEHGTPLEDPTPLVQLFGVERGEGKMNYGRTKVAFAAAAEGIDLRGSEVELYGRESVSAQGAQALAAHASGEPAVFVCRMGRGLSVYLNFCLPPYDPVTRQLVGQITHLAGVTAGVVVESTTGGQPPRCYERNSFSRGPIAVHTLIRDHRRCEDTNPVRLRFARPGHVYQVRGGKYEGRVDSLVTTLAPGETAVYAVLPYRVTGLEMQSAERAAAGSQVEMQLEVHGDDGPPGDHVLHVELCGPDGQVVPHYTQNVLAAGGKAAVRVPLALNDQAGSWTIRACDVLSGTTAERRFEVAP